MLCHEILFKIESVGRLHPVLELCFASAMLMNQSIVVRERDIGGRNPKSVVQKNSLPHFCRDRAPDRKSLEADPPQVQHMAIFFKFVKGFGWISLLFPRPR